MSFCLFLFYNFRLSKLKKCVSDSGHLNFGMFDEAGGKGKSFRKQECWKDTKSYDNSRPLGEFPKHIDKYGRELYWNGLNGMLILTNEI